MDQTLKHVVLVGPVYPYKGGIAHYNAMLYQELKQRYKITLISYKLLYPKFLYKKDQKDYSDNFFEVPETKFWLNSANPLNIIGVARKIRDLKPNMVILPWWHPYFAPCYRILGCFLRGIKIVFICHNVFPHERFPMDRVLTRWTLKRGDAFITHSRMDRNDLENVIESPMAITSPLPTFNSFKRNNLSKTDARQLLNYAEDEKLLLFFGFVREYKGLKHLLRAMPSLVEIDPKIRLMVVGDFGSDRDDYFALIRELRIEKNVDVVEGYVPDKEVEKYFAACDLVVLPYESATQSGIVQIAFGFEKPVIVTDVGGLPDVVSNKKTGYVVPTKSPDSLTKAILDYYQNNEGQFMTEHIREEAYRFSWSCFVDRLEELWKRI